MLMRFDPFRELDRLTQQAFGTSRSAGLPAVMPMDAYRHGEQFVVQFDLPGLDPSSIDVTVEKNVLTVKAERNWQRPEGAEIVASERPQGSFTRQLFLGEALDVDRLEASYEHGVLTVTVPVAEQAKARKVAIGAGHGPGNGKAGAIEAQSAQTT